MLTYKKKIKEKLSLSFRWPIKPDKEAVSDNELGGLGPIVAAAGGELNMQRHTSIVPSAVQDSVQGSAVQCSAGKFSAVQCDTVQDTILPITGSRSVS